MTCRWRVWLGLGVVLSGGLHPTQNVAWAFESFGYQTGTGKGLEGQDSYAGGIQYLSDQHQVVLTGLTYESSAGGLHAFSQKSANNKKGSTGDCFLGTLTLPTNSNSNINININSPTTGTNDIAVPTPTPPTSTPPPSKTGGVPDFDIPTSGGTGNNNEDLNPGDNTDGDGHVDTEHTNGGGGSNRNVLRRLASPSALTSFLTFGLSQSPEVCSAVLPMPQENKVYAVGHTPESGLLTALRKRGSDKATMYGFVMDVDTSLNDASDNNGLVGGVLFHDDKVQYPVSIVSSTGITSSSATATPLQYSLFVALMETQDTTVSSPEDYLDHVLLDGILPSPHSPPQLDHTAGGGGGVQPYGHNFALRIKKLGPKSPGEFEQDALLREDAAKEANVAATMHVLWSRLYETSTQSTIYSAGLLHLAADLSATKPDLLLFAGTTRGTGRAFGGTFGTSMNDLDGFITKLAPETGNIPLTAQGTMEDGYGTRFSARISSDVDGQDDIVTAMCAQPQTSLQTSQPTSIFVVGSTTGVLDTFATDTIRDKETAVQAIGATKGRPPLHAFLMKLNVDTLDVEWVRQLGAVMGRGTVHHDAVGMGCAVSPDGERVFLAGHVKDGAVLNVELRSTNQNMESQGKTDFFVAEYAAANGGQVAIRQVGTKGDDLLARGSPITTDLLGNPIVTGTTRGSLFRTRDLKNIQDTAPADVFVMTFERGTLLHREPLQSVDSNSSSSSKRRGLTVGGIFSFILFFLLFAFVVVFVVRAVVHLKVDRDMRFHQPNTNEVHMYLQDFDDVECDLKHSATGGWHGQYDIEPNPVPESSKQQRSGASASASTDMDIDLVGMNSGAMSDIVKDALFDNDDDSHDDDDDDDDDDDEDLLDGSGDDPELSGHRNRKTYYNDLVDAYDDTWDSAAGAAEAPLHGKRSSRKSSKNNKFSSTQSASYSMPGSGVGQDKTSTSTNLVDDAWGAEII
eukprot:CAMPEP_0198283258 /NCGR_PEP_ID=MMETSP1449-20131203/2912_1 /TAXON_ID=420275 /ORGANISM="Attheya septentrionalis, Strain CCMP2084" /LENGTH=965 /DNA_ID=CAMNT_0043979827 /DNA_START=313 /DNA_END=3210 /DNA_ORIENTATION=-